MTLDQRPEDRTTINFSKPLSLKEVGNLFKYINEGLISKYRWCGVDYAIKKEKIIHIGLMEEDMPSETLLTSVYGAIKRIGKDRVYVMPFRLFNTDISQTIITDMSFTGIWFEPVPLGEQREDEIKQVIRNYVGKQVNKYFTRKQSTT